MRVVESETLENLEKFECVVFPGGSPVEQGNTIGEAGVSRVRAFVSNGGGYLGICAGAFLGAVNSVHPLSGLRLLPVSFSPSVLKSPVELCGMIVVKPGRFDDNDARFADFSIDDDESKHLTMRFRNGCLFAPEQLKKGEVEVVASVSECNSMPKRFRSTMIRKACIIAGKFGLGNVVLCGPHPEVTETLDEFTWGLFEIALGKREKNKK